MSNIREIIADIKRITGDEDDNLILTKTMPLTAEQKKIVVVGEKLREHLRVERVRLDTMKDGLMAEIKTKNDLFKHAEIRVNLQTYEIEVYDTKPDGGKPVKSPIQML